MFWGFVFQAQVLKVEVPDVAFEPPAPWGEGLGFEFSPRCGSPHQGNFGPGWKIMARLCSNLTHLLQCSFLLVFPKCSCHSASL